MSDPGRGHLFETLNHPSNLFNIGVYDRDCIEGPRDLDCRRLRKEKEKNNFKNFQRNHQTSELSKNQKILPF